VPRASAWKGATPHERSSTQIWKRGERDRQGTWGGRRKKLKDRYSKKEPLRSWKIAEERKSQGLTAAPEKLGLRIFMGKYATTGTPRQWSRKVVVELEENARAQKEPAKSKGEGKGLELPVEL